MRKIGTVMSHWGKIKTIGRRGTATVEAAIVLPLLLVLMLGLWQVAQIVQTARTLDDAAREGARVAAGGITNGTNVTVAVVQQTVQNYLTAAGFPAAAAAPPR